MTTIKTAKQIFWEYPQLSFYDEQPCYVPLAEYEVLQTILKRWVEIGPRLEDQPFDEDVNVSPDLQRLIADTQVAVKGE